MCMQVAESMDVDFSNYLKREKLYVSFSFQLVSEPI